MLNAVVMEVLLGMGGCWGLGGEEVEEGGGIGAASRTKHDEHDPKDGLGAGPVAGTDVVDRGPPESERPLAPPNVVCGLAVEVLDLVRGPLAPA